LKSLNDFVGELLVKLRHLNGVATLLKATPQRSLHLRLVSPGWLNLDAFIIRELILPRIGSRLSLRVIRSKSS
jgi:hypothetical protein